MIKILNIISDTNIGGAGRYIINFLKYYDRSRYEVKLVLPYNSLLKPEIEKLDTEVIEADGLAEKSFSWKAVKSLRRIIKEEKPDIVHTHGALSGRVAAKGTGAKIVFTRHSAFPVPDRIRKQPGRFINKTLNEMLADRIIAVSHAAEENLTDGGISSDLIDTMMNGVEPVPRSSKEACDDLRRQYGIEKGTFVMSIIARLEHYKGHLIVLDAIKELREQGRECRLLIAGNGGFEEEIRRHCTELGLDDCVSFMGFVTDTAALLSVLDLQLNASYGTETSSLSVLEGFSMGVPAVISDYGGNPWLVDDGENGYLFPNKDSHGMAECIAKLMDDPELLARMGERALEIYKERFTGEIFAGNIEAVYEKVTGARGI